MGCLTCPQYWGINSLGFCFHYKCFKVGKDVLICEDYNTPEESYKEKIFFVVLGFLLSSLFLWIIK